MIPKEEKSYNRKKRRNAQRMTIASLVSQIGHMIRSNIYTPMLLLRISKVLGHF